MSRRILITGPESTGKSELSAALTELTPGALRIPEYARAYLHVLNRPYHREDLTSILFGQLAAEEEALSQRPPWLYCDTGPEVLLIWSEVKYGRVDSVIRQAFLDHTYDFTLLCYPDLTWTYDPLREAPDEAERHGLFARYRQLLVGHNRPFAVVRGEGNDRIACALDGIADFFGSAR